MGRLSFVFISALTCWGALAGAARISSAEPAPISAEDAAEGARLFEAGLAAFEAGDMPGALERLTRAHDLAPNYRSAAVLGQVELELGRFVGAATHLDESVRLFPRGTDVEGFGRVMDGLSEARRHVCTLRVQSPTRGAVLWIDGKRQGALPLHRDLFVSPGAHVIEVRAEGFVTLQREEQLPRGGVRDLSFELEPVPNAEGAATTSEPPLGARATLWTGGAIALAGVVTGTVFELAARSSEQAWRQLHASGGCPTDSGVCSELRRENDRATTLHDAAAVSFVSAGAVAVVTVSLYAWLGQGAPSEANVGTEDVAVTPWVGPGGAGIGVTGGF